MSFAITGKKIGTTPQPSPQIVTKAQQKKPIQPKTKPVADLKPKVTPKPKATDPKNKKETPKKK